MSRLVIHAALIAILVALSGCATQMKVAEIDQTTGTLKSERGEVTKATVVTAKPASIAKFNGTAFISNGGDYGVNQLRATKLFETVLSYDDLQKLVVANNLQDKVSSLNEPIGLSRLAKAYKPFLWINFKRTTHDNKPYMQMIASNPETLEDLFIAEVYLDFVWAGVQDQNSRYPLFNAMIAWVRKNP